MAPPSQLAILTSSLLRLVKEEASYHKELVQQEARVKKLETEGGDENVEFTLKQEVRTIPIVNFGSTLFTSFQRRAIEETKAVFPELKNKIADAVEKLGAQLVGLIYSNVMRM